jgi:hypothetical protein
LYFLNETTMPAILIEVCFVDSEADAEIYRREFAHICKAIATIIVGEEAIKPPVPPPVAGMPERIFAWRDNSWAERPTPQTTEYVRADLIETS